MPQAIHHAGIDVSKAWLDAATCDGRTQRFDNTPTGHRSLIAWLAKPGRQSGGDLSCRVVLESTGTYGLDLALALDADERCEIMVANPRLIKGFAQALARRSKTDAVDAQTILAFAQRMPFQPWSPPGAALLELRAMARRIDDLTVERTREKNRLSALDASASHSRLIARDIGVNIGHLDRRVDRMIAQAVALIRAHAGLAAAFGHLTSVKGFAGKSAVALLGELMVLPSDMSPKQWVAHAGLDPREYESGSSVHRKVRISKVGNPHIRRALFMPALVALRTEPRVSAFYEELRAKGKGHRVAQVAVMRKLLHSIHGMLRHGADFDGEKFRATPEEALAGA
jgi:transposase